MSTAAEHLATEFARPCLSLASSREKLGITFEQIAQSTRIAPHYLRAIEAEDFAKLPSGVYALSYIRQYARAIGYSETALLDHYRARRQPEPPPLLAVQPCPRATTRFGEALGEAMELFHWWSPAKPRTHHPA
jgi:transcriptional regulator with XRE-family HTH domain